MGNMCSKVAPQKKKGKFLSTYLDLGEIYNKKIQITFLPTYLTSDCHKRPDETKHILGLAWVKMLRMAENGPQDCGFFQLLP